AAVPVLENCSLSFWKRGLLTPDAFLANYKLRTTSRARYTTPMPYSPSVSRILSPDGDTLYDPQTVSVQPSPHSLCVGPGGHRAAKRSAAKGGSSVQSTCDLEMQFSGGGGVHARVNEPRSSSVSGARRGVRPNRWNHHRRSQRPKRRFGSQRHHIRHK